ncbi:MAG: hypothetical protein AAF430_20375 [Myxococcota bacterium]
MNRTCYFHAGCPDGFGAAWSVWRHWGEDARYVARGHNDVLDPSAHAGHEVVFVDIAPSNEELRGLAPVAARVVVLDHHISAQERYASDPGAENLVVENGHEVRFDLGHSGAVLAWQYFHPGTQLPPLLAYVEDQDLWNWALPRSAEVNAAIGSHRREFAIWDELDARGAEVLAGEGEPILRAQRADVRRSLLSAHPVTVAGHRVEAVNAPHQRSHIGHELAKRAAYGHAIGLVYRLNGRTVDASIYSIGDVDVASIAEGYDGGGHRNAAGFSVSLEQWSSEFC